METAMNAQHKAGIFRYVGPLAALVLAAGCVTEEQGRAAAEQTATQALNEDVGTRGVAQATPRRGVQLPTWPQRFELSGPEPASFAFAVTQPGPVQVDVQTQGAPVRVALAGSQQREQIGSGRVALNLLLTPQDIQRGVLWHVRIVLHNLPKTAGAVQASGTITVKHAPADVSVVQAHLNAHESQKRLALQQADSKIRAAIDVAIQRSRAQVAKQHDDLRLAAEMRAKPRLEQLRLRGQVGTRGVAADTMTLEPLGIATMLQQPPRQLQALPAPRITRTDAGQGLPRQMVLIEGTAFGTQVGAVLFVVNPGIELRGFLEAWSDTLIAVRVPDVSGIPSYGDGKISVVRGSDAQHSAAWPFQFVQELEYRYLQGTRDCVIAQPGAMDVWGNNGQVSHGYFNFWQVWAGYKGNDVLFPSTRLGNGWTVDLVSVYPSTWSGFGVSSGNAWVVDSRPGTDTPYMNVRWWRDALNELFYRYTVQIKGPRGVPDGVLVTGPVNPILPPGSQL
jgi:hypothetical protein